MRDRPRKTRSRTSVWRWIARTIGAIIVVFGLGFAALIGRLIYGPIESETVARIAERVASEALGAGRKATIGHAALALSLDEGIAILLDDISVGSEDEGVTVVVPSAAIRVWTFPLIIGQVKPWSLDVNGATALIDLEHLDAGKLVAATAQGGQGAAPAPAPAVAPQPAQTKGARETDPVQIRQMEEVGRMLSSAVEHIHIEDLRSIYARNARIDLTFPRKPDGTRRRVSIPEIELASLFNTKDTDADVSFSARGGVGRWSMRLRQVTDKTDGSRRMLFEGSDVTLYDLTGIDDPTLRVEMPFYPFLMVGFDKEGGMREARLSAKLGAGVFRFGKEPEDEALVDEGELDLAWDADGRRVMVNRLSLDFGPTHLGFIGSVTPPSAGQTIWTGRLDLDKGVLAARDVGTPPLTLNGAFLQGSFDQQSFQLTLEDIQAHFANSAIRAAGSIDLRQTPPIVAINAVATPIEAQPLGRIWPHWVAPGGRRWFVDNVQKGRVSGAQARLRFPLGVDPPLWPDDSVYVDARFDNGVSTMFGALPPINGAEGKIHLERRTFEASVEKGVVATKTAKPATVQSFRLVIPDALRKSPKAAMELHFNGEAAAAAEIVNSDPLNVLDHAGVKPTGLSGTADVSGKVDMVFDPDPANQNIVYRFEAILDKFASVNPILGRKFTDGQIKIVADNAGTTVTGKAKIDGVPTDVNMYEPSDKAASERRDFSMLLDDATRGKIGLDLAGIVAGPMKVDVGQDPDKENVKKFTIDLTQARLNLYQFGWTKGAGVAAKATFDLVEDPKAMRLDNFAVDSEGLQIRGQLGLDAAKQLATADIQKFSLHKGDDARMKMQRGSDGVLNITFEASSFDVRSLIQAMRKSDSTSSSSKQQTSSKGSDINVKVRAARLVGFNDVTLSDVVIDGQLRQQNVAKLQMTGRAPGGRSLQISITPDGNQRQLVMTSDDAGAVVAFADVFDRLRQGTLRINARMSSIGAADGKMQIIGFRLAHKGDGNKPVASRTENGVQEYAVKDADIPDDAAFDRFGLTFSLRKGVITVTDGIAKGPATGATASGQIDLNNQRLNIAGTFIPLYGLNNIVSRIPILGEIAGAGRNEGLVGVTFNVVGPIDDPLLQFNPLSAIAPGILRKIFEYRPEGPNVQQ